MDRFARYLLGPACAFVIAFSLNAGVISAEEAGPKIALDNYHKLTIHKYSEKKFHVESDGVGLQLTYGASGCHQPDMYIDTRVEGREVYLELYIENTGDCEAYWHVGAMKIVKGLEPGEYTFFYPEGAKLSISQSTAELKR